MSGPAPDAAAPGAASANVTATAMGGGAAHAGEGTAVPPGIAIRDETPADAAQVAALLDAAFGGPDEALLVADLHAAGAATVALVAEGEGGRVLGHILFSPLEIVHRGRTPIHALALAPLAVLPSHQFRGIGAALVRAGLERCRAIRCPGVVVLGDPHYYRRFGFRSHRAERFAAPWTGETLQAMDLAPHGLGDGTGTLRYHPAFDRFVDTDTDTDTA